MFTHLVFDGVADGPLGVALDIVASAERIVSAGLVRGMKHHRQDWQQQVVSITGESVRSSAGRLVPVDGALSVKTVSKSTVIAIPGLGAPTEALVETLLKREDVARGAQCLARAQKKGAVIAASCSATFVLAQAGLLDGHEATTTWWLRGAFAKRFPKVELSVEKMVVESERVLTAGSAFAHADLMLALIARTRSASVAHWVARYLVLDHRDSQSRYMVTEHLRTQDPALRKLESYVRQQLDRQLSIDELARAAQISARTLARRIHDALGTTPQRWVQRLRMAHARHLLESTKESVENVALSVGYADAAAFRRVFQREMGISPREAR